MTVLHYPSRVPVDWEHDTLDPTMMCVWSNPADNRKDVRGSLRTIAHLDYVSALAVDTFGQRVHVIQPPYNTGVPASAGTHDRDVCLDWYLPGVDWWTAQRFWRTHGGWCWYRHPPLFGNHLHGGVLPLGRHFATPVGIYVPGQLVDYYNHAFGLAGQHTPGSDRSWFPPDIDAVIFDLDAFIHDQREALDMQLSDPIRPHDDGSPTVGQTLSRIDRFITRQDDRAKTANRLLREVLTGDADDATKGQVRRVLDVLTADDPTEPPAGP